MPGNASGRAQLAGRLVVAEVTGAERLLVSPAKQKVVTVRKTAQAPKTNIDFILSIADQPTEQSMAPLRHLRLLWPFTIINPPSSTLALISPSSNASSRV